MNEPVRFVAFTDHHGAVDCIESVLDLAESSHASFIVCAGDFSFMTEGLHPSMKMLGMCGLPLFFVGGNHEHSALCTAVTRAFPTLKYVDLRAEKFEIPGKGFIQIAGLDGTDDLNPHYGVDQETHGNYLETLQGRIDPRLPLILLTHYPPAGTQCCGREPIFRGPLCVGFKDQPALGSQVVRRVVEALEPRIVVTGHFHELFGVQDRIGNTLVLNPGPKGMVLTMEI